MHNSQSNPLVFEYPSGTDASLLKGILFNLILIHSETRKSHKNTVKMSIFQKFIFKLLLFTVNNLKTQNPYCRIYLCCIKSTSLIHYICWLFIVHQCYLPKIAFCSNYTYHSIFDLLQCLNMTNSIYFGNVMLREVAENEKWASVTNRCGFRFHTTK